MKSAIGVGVAAWVRKVVLIALAFRVGSGVVAQTVEVLDAQSGAGGNIHFSQAANDYGSLGLGNVYWIGSILQQNNSRYVEGMSVPQRIIFKGIGATEGNEHSLTFSHQAMKAEAHAYDFLTSWDQALAAAAAIEPKIALFVALNECGDEIGSDSQGYKMTCTMLHGPDGHFVDVDIPDETGDPPCSNGCDVGAKIAGYESRFGNRTLRLYGDRPISNAVLIITGYSGTKDECLNYMLTWESESTDIVIETAGHLGVGIDPLKADIGYGLGLGAASISGGPYHFNLHDIDGASLGSKDNQIKGADIMLPSLGCELTSNNGPLCEGATLQLETEYAEGATYLWTGPGGFTSIERNPVIPYVTTNESGFYMVSMTLNGETVECVTEVIVHAPPECGIEGPDGPHCPADTGLVYSGPSNMATYAWMVSGNALISGPDDQESVTIDVAGDCTNSFTLSLAITDLNGCSSDCSREIDVSDPAPVITCPSNITVQCDYMAPHAATNLAGFAAQGGNITDTCGGPYIFLSEDIELPGEGCAIVIARTYTVIDGCGNSSRCTQEITVHDTTPPTLLCPLAGIIQCEGDLPGAATTAAELADYGGSLSDNCTASEDLVLTSDDTGLTGGPCTGLITRTYTAFDECGNSSTCEQYFMVQDTLPPQVTAPPDRNLQCIEELPPAATDLQGFLDAMGSAQDNCGGELTVSSEDLDLEGDLCGGTIRRVYTISDVCGNATNVVQTFKIDDTQAPSITCPPQITVPTTNDVPPGVTDTNDFADLGGTLSDNCAGELQIWYEDGPLTNGLCGGTITRTYTVSDPCGNLASCEQIIMVNDDIPPRITVCPEDITISRMEPVPAGATNLPQFRAAGGDVWDNNGLEDLVIGYKDSEPRGDACESVITRTYTVVDVCDNLDTCQQEIRILDGDPVIFCPDDYVFSCEECPEDTSPDIFGRAEAFDDDGTALEVTYTDRTNGVCPRVVARTWSAVDPCSNEVHCVQTIACLPPALVTSSALCTFDRDPELPGRQFRLIYTHDGTHKVCGELTASNPGQFFFNTLYHGTPGELITFFLILPFPFVTQGGTPIHAYDGVGVAADVDGSICLLPENGIWQSKQQVTLDMYGATSTVTVAAENLVVPDTGTIYLNIHLDYGLKGFGGLGRDQDFNAIECWDSDGNGVLDVIVPNYQDYVFELLFTNQPPTLVQDTVMSLNDFKHVPGISGLVLDAGLAPMPGLAVNLVDPKGTVLAETETDNNGAYVLSYKRKGKGREHFVVLYLPDGTMQYATVVLGADDYIQVNFRVD